MNLPNVFQNKSIKINNDKQDFFYGNKIINTKKSKNIDISKKINNLFNSKNYVYKLNVHVVTKNEEFDTTIIGKNNTHLITYENDLINLGDIIDIYKKED